MPWLPWLPAGNAFCDRGFADVFLRHGSHAHDDEPFAVRYPTGRLPARSHAPGAPEDDVARGGGHRPQSRRLGVEVRIVRRSSVTRQLPRAWRGRHHEDRQRCPPRDAGTPLTPGGSQQDHVDHNTCELTTRTLQGAVLDLAVVPSDSKPHVVVSALENPMLPDDRVGVHW